MPHIRYVPIKGGGGGDCSFHFCNDLFSAIFCPNYDFSMMTQDSQQIWRVSTGTKVILIVFGEAKNQLHLSNTSQTRQGGVAALYKKNPRC